MYLQILSNVHVNNNSTILGNNKDELYKLCPLIDSLNNNYVKLCNVLHQVSIDRSMILFKGQSSLKQYNPQKPIKRGYKLVGDVVYEMTKSIQGKYHKVYVDDYFNFFMLI